MGYRILAVGDGPVFKGLVSPCADKGEYDLDSALTGSQGMALAQAQRPDLLLLDSRLPDVEGLLWLRMLRQTELGRDLPVIVMSERRTDAEVAEAFDWGADDFVELPCDPAEVLARVRAVLRRRFERQEYAGYAMTLGPVTLDPVRHECRVRGKSVDLKPREFELLEILMRKAGRVLSRSYLLETVWGMSRNADTRAVDVGISRLRRSLGRRAGSLVETVERFGYRFKAA